PSCSGPPARTCHTLFPSATLFRSFALMVVGLFAATVLPNVFAGDPSTVAVVGQPAAQVAERSGLETTNVDDRAAAEERVRDKSVDRKSTRLNSSHVKISYAVFCLK